MKVSAGQILKAVRFVSGSVNTSDREKSLQREEANKTEQKKEKFQIFHGLLYHFLISGEKEIHVSHFHIAIMNLLNFQVFQPLKLMTFHFFQFAQKSFSYSLFSPYRQSCVQKTESDTVRRQRQGQWQLLLLRLVLTLAFQKKTSALKVFLEGRDTVFTSNSQLQPFDS